MAKDYYSVLGVEKTSSKDEIKKAFHKLAHKYHPDKNNGDDAKFKEVNEAYQILSDERKRAEYDRYGETFANGGGAGQGGFGFDWGGFQNQEGYDMGDLGDIFSDFFGNRRSQMRRGRDISTEITISFRESVFGVVRKILISKVGVCDTCEGKGGEPNTSFKQCSSCNGKGRIHESKKTILGSFSVEHVCSTCNGRGEVPEKLCHTCGGLGIHKKNEEISINVPAGIDDGQMIRMTSMGEAISQGEPGDLYIKVNVTADSKYVRQGSNIITLLKVKLSDALLGASYTVETLDGNMSIKIPEGIIHGEMLRLKEKGIPNGKGKRGDMLVKIDIVFPKKLSHSQKEIIKKLAEEGL